MQLLSYALAVNLDWTGLDAATPVVPEGLEGSTAWHTSY